MEKGGGEWKIFQRGGRFLLFPSRDYERRTHADQRSSQSRAEDGKNASVRRPTNRGGGYTEGGKVFVHSDSSYGNAKKAWDCRTENGEGRTSGEREERSLELIIQFLAPSVTGATMSTAAAWLTETTVITST